ncbi:hypothetical protein MY4038_010134 [Beauveria bassiana]
MSTASGNTTNPAQVVQQMHQQIAALTAQVQALQTNPGGGATHAIPKFPKPEAFDGTKGNVRTFLTQAKAYLKVNTAIDREPSKILCIGNLLTGKAMEWWEPTLRDYLDNDDLAAETTRIFDDYDNFEELLKTAFGDPDEIQTATRKLKALKQTGEDVKDEIAKKDRPDDFDRFVEQAIKINNRLYARKLERGGKGMSHRGNPPRRYQPNTGRRRNGSTAYKTHPGPMELDVANREKDEEEDLEMTRSEIEANADVVLETPLNEKKDLGILKIDVKEAFI